MTPLSKSHLDVHSAGIHPGGKVAEGAMSCHGDITLLPPSEKKNPKYKKEIYKYKNCRLSATCRYGATVLQHLMSLRTELC